MLPDLETIKAGLLVAGAEAVELECKEGKLEHMAYYKKSI